MLTVLVWLVPRAGGGATPSGSLLALELERGARWVEIHVTERRAQFVLQEAGPLEPARELGLLSYDPVIPQAADRHHATAERYRVRGFVRSPSSGGQVPYLKEVSGRMLVPVLADYFNVMQANARDLLTTEDASRLFGMTLNAFKQSGAIPIYETQNPR